MENKISMTITPETRTSAEQAIDALQTAIPGLITLTADERREMLKMGPKTLDFVEKAMYYAKNNPQLVPSYVDTDEFGIDWQTVKDMQELISRLLPFYEALNDTAMLAGSEAYYAALGFYNSLKMAAKSGVPGAAAIYEELRRTRPGRKTQQAAQVDTNQINN